MDASRILVALEEQDKWRDRRARLEERLRVVRARKRFLQRELDLVRHELSSMLESVLAYREETIPRELAITSLERIR